MSTEITYSNKTNFLTMLGIFIFCIIIFFIHSSKALPDSDFHLGSDQKIVVEHIRLHVPKDKKDAWLEAERQTWEPWLSKKNGFLGRKLYWDQSREEATLLISWSNRSIWKSIPQSEINSVQDLFEEIAREKTGQQNGNPFPIEYEGELLPQ